MTIINAARDAFVQSRAKEIIATPGELAGIVFHIIIADPGQFGVVLGGVLKERVGALADLIDLVEGEAINTARAEWVEPVL